MAGRKRVASPSGGACTAKKTRKKKSVKSNVFPFLRLPAEVRNMVYHYVFVGTCYTLIDHQPSKAVKREYRKAMGPPKDTVDLSLLYVSRQLNYETATLPYKLGVFRFGTNTHPRNSELQKLKFFMGFLEQRSRAQIEALSHIGVFGYKRPACFGFLGGRKERWGSGRYWIAQLDVVESWSCASSKQLARE
ncbi:unnamed protein product [Alternaria burnsii]|nr:unnamed protein product [Alternaria burnsii]